MGAPISVCMITLGEPSLTRAIASVRPWVAEVCVLHTGPEASAAKPEGVDRYEAMQWGDDFAAARNASFAMATQPYILWLDSDDTLEGGGQLENLCAPMGAPHWFWLPYEYERDAAGAPTCLLSKPRIVTLGHFEWRFAIHEELLPLDAASVRTDVSAYNVHSPRVIHHRAPTEARSATERNIRILRKELEKSLKDTRSLFYLGCALFDARDFEASEATFAKFLAMPAPDSQRAMACARLSTVRELRGDLRQALLFAMAAVTENPVAESYFAVARIHRLAAEQGGPGAKREWAKVQHFAEVGLSLPETHGGLWVNPMDREFYAREMLACALAELGDKRQAIETARAALKVRDDEDLRGQVEAWSESIRA